MQWPNFIRHAEGGSVKRLGESMARAVLVALISAVAIRAPMRAQVPAAAPQIKAVTVSEGVELHYVEMGKGEPVVFVHGSLSDGGFWNPQLAPFAEKYHVIAYSRRYNPPNKNKPQADYSAVTDADDLAGLIEKLHLGRTNVIGHSYGAYTALFLAVRHPELVCSLVVAEAPAMPLLAYLPGDEAELGKKAL